MTAVAIRQMADRVGALMDERLCIRGTGLDDRLARGGRLLPLRVRKAARGLAAAAEGARDPRRLMQIDFEQVSADYDICVRHLTGLGPWARWMGTALTFARVSLAAGLLAAGVGYALMRWRGLV